MITEMKAKLAEMVATTGNNKMWCALQMAKAMTDDELISFANETGNSRYISTAQRVVTGVNPRDGATLTAKEQASYRTDMNNIVVSNLTA